MKVYLGVPTRTHLLTSSVQHPAYCSFKRRVASSQAYLRKRPAVQYRHRACNTVTRADAVVGIDLGTTNSAVAAMQDGVPKILRVDGDKPTMPSVVHFDSDGATVGRQAAKLQPKDPANTFHSVKRFIGQPYSRVAEEAAKMAYAVREDEDGCPRLECPALGAQLHPEEVSGLVLQKLIQDAEQLIRAPVTKAVITVPAYFDDAQREATREAGLAAGLEKVQLLREPQAAAIAYGLRQDDDSLVLVFDLGGGTFDVSILAVGGGTIEVLATGGDPNLGGNDFDAAIMGWVRAQAAKAGFRLPDHPRAQHSLRAVARAAKEALTEAPRTVVRLPTGGGRFWEVTLTRQRLDQLSTPLVNRMRMPLEMAAEAAGVDLSLAQAMAKGRARRPTGAMIDQVLLVGGATRMPSVRRFVKNMMGVKPKTSLVDPDEVVALGAAVQAGILEGTVDDLDVFDSWQATLMRALATAKLQEREREASGTGPQLPGPLPAPPGDS